MSIGEQIRAGREELRLTQEELAEKLDISRQAVSKCCLLYTSAQKVEGGMVYGGALRMVGEDERNWGL